MPAQYAALHRPSVEDSPLQTPPPPPGAGLSPSSSNKDFGSTHNLYAPPPPGGAGARRAIPASQGFWTKRNKIIALAAGIIVIALAIAIPVGIVKGGDSDSSGSGSSSDSSDGNGDHHDSSSLIQWGGDGSTVTLDDGTNVTYTNSFGGTWTSVPFNNSAKAQSFTPSLDEEWNFAERRIAGINLGGWLLPEPFIASYLFEPFLDSNPQAVDEYTLSQALGNDLATTLEDHYKTFITEQDFIEIAAAGLNWIRLPIGYWAIETWDDEPFLEGVSWNYVLKAIKWARKYGLRVNLDLHAVPGSQNALNHSGKMGAINFLSGPMGIYNAQRTLRYIRTLAHFTALPDYKNVVPFLGILNEPQVGEIGMTQMKEFFVQAYNTIRDATGTGNGNGPYMHFHDGFQGQPNFYGFLAGADRVSIDTHNYLAFNTPPSNIPINTSMTIPCSSWANTFNESQSRFGVSTGGEWSLALNDCGHYINSIQVGSSYAETFGEDACTPFTDWENYSDETKRQLTQLTLANMDTVVHSFFWTWKIANSTLPEVSPNPPNPAWHYRLGWKEGYIPSDPRDAVGACASLAQEYASPSASASIATFGDYEPWATGAVTSVSADSQSFVEWPPATITNVTGNAAELLPQLTPTGAPVIMPTENEVDADDSTITPDPSFTQSVLSPASESNWLTTAEGCNYQDPWCNGGCSMPASGCGIAATPAPTPAAARRKRRSPQPAVTPAPYS